MEKEDGKDGRQDGEEDGGERSRARRARDFLKDFLMMNAGALLLATGVYFFKTQNHFVTGGVSGLSILLEALIPVDWLSQSVWMLMINAALLVVGFVFLGRGCTFRTVYCSLAYSLEVWLFERFVGLDGPLTDDVLLELVYAILLTGVGSAVLFYSQATSGGTDIIAMILRRHTRLNVGTALLVTDIVISAASFFVFDVPTGLYSVLGLFARAFLIDGVIESIGRNKSITVITTRPQEIGDFIIREMRHTYTSYPATGGYTGEERTVIVTVCRRIEAYRIKTAAKKADPSAFIIINDADEIVGKGFRETL